MEQPDQNSCHQFDPGQPPVNDGGEPPSGWTENNTFQNNTGKALLLGGPMACLLAGLAVSFFYKRKS